MGAVFAGIHRIVRSPRAIKVLLTTGDDEDAVDRLHREAYLSARLHHCNIDQIFDVNQQDDIHYMAMELVEGVSLLQLLRNGGVLPIERVALLLRQVAGALDYAHGVDIVHNDIKPSNIIVGPDDHVTLIDFGIARALNQSRLERVGVVVGTFEYMAPEIVNQGGGSPGTDLYALGVVAYQMLAGRVPFTGESAYSIMYRHIHESPIPPSRFRPELPKGIDAAILRNLERSHDRFSTGLKFIDALGVDDAGLLKKDPHRARKSTGRLTKT